MASIKTLKNKYQNIKAPTYKKPAAYKSEYADQLKTALDGLLNYGDFNYDYTTDEKYKTYAKEFGRLGNLARQNTLGDMSANTGGYASSAATVASAEAQNDYNRQLGAMIPELEEAAYGRWMDKYNMGVSNYDLVKGADDTAYGKYRDTVGDTQWQYGMDWDKYSFNKDFAYNQYRDAVGDNQWTKTFNYNKSNDQKNYNQQKNQFNKTFNENKRQFNAGRK